LLILVLEMKPKAFESFKIQANRVLPVPLPPADKLKSLRLRKGFIWFSTDWTPILLPLTALRSVLQAQPLQTTQPAL
jgi:hypothetical protein